MGGYWWIGFPYGKATNRHAGCAIALAQRFFGPPNIVRIEAPVDKRLRGRAGLVRVKGAQYDITVFVVYLPPSFRSSMLFCSLWSECSTSCPRARSLSSC